MSTAKPDYGPTCNTRFWMPHHERSCALAPGHEGDHMSDQLCPKGHPTGYGNPCGTGICVIEEMIRMQAHKAVAHVFVRDDKPRNDSSITMAERFELLTWAGQRPGMLRLLRALKAAYYDETGTEYLRRIVEGSGIKQERRIQEAGEDARAWHWVCSRCGEGREQKSVGGIPQSLRCAECGVETMRPQPAMLVRKLGQGEQLVCKRCGRPRLRGQVFCGAACSSLWESKIPVTAEEREMVVTVTNKTGEPRQFYQTFHGQMPSAGPIPNPTLEPAGLVDMPGMGPSRVYGLEVVPAPGDLCGGTKFLPSETPCPGCRACQ